MIFHVCNLSFFLFSRAETAGGREAGAAAKKSAPFVRGTRAEVEALVRLRCPLHADALIEAELKAEGVFNYSDDIVK
jgi:hypothetical protein